MGSTFAIVLVGVVIVGAVVAVATSLASGGVYERIGSGSFALDRESRSRPPAAGSAAARAEAQEEIRQLVEAKSARRVARGGEPLDVDAEVAALSAPSHPPVDASLRDEVRQLVVARNSRRSGRGEEPLDVDQEIERQLREMGA